MPSSFPIAQLFVAALVMAPSVLITPVHADVVYDTHTITASGPDTIGYTYFDLAASDTVEVRTMIAVRFRLAALPVIFSTR